METVQEVQRSSRTLRKSQSSERRFSLDDFEEHTETEDAGECEGIDDVSPGTLPDAVYNAQLSWWRSATRRALKRSLKHESRILGKIQVGLNVRSRLVLIEIVAESRAHQIPRLVLSLFVGARQSYFLHVCSSRVILLWLRRDR